MRNQSDPCRSQHYLEVTNLLGTTSRIHIDPNINQIINRIHVDPNTTLRLPILWAVSWIHVNPNINLRLPILSSNQLDSNRSQHHLRVTNLLGAINRI